MEEVQRRMNGLPGNQGMVLNDLSKVFYCNEDLKLRGKIIIGTIDGDGTVHIETTMGRARNRQAAAAGMNVADTNTCWHGTTKENYSSECQEILDDYLREFNERMSSIQPLPRELYPSSREEMEDIAMKRFDEIVNASKNKALSNRGALDYDEIAKHAFACSAKRIIDGGDEEFSDGHNGIILGLYCHDIAGKAPHSDAFTHANERFNVYLHRLDKTLRGATRVLAKHLPCRCMKDRKPLSGPIGRKIKRCDACRIFKLNTALKDCSACKMVCYCSKECQISDWKDNHKHHCKLMRS